MDNKFAITIILLCLLISVSSSLIVYKMLGNINTEKKSYNISEAYSKAEIDSKLQKINGNGMNDFASRLYFKEKQGRFNSEEYAPNVDIRCDNNDIVLSGTCLGLPYYGGDTITVGSQMGASNPPYTTVDWFSCNGAIYDIQGDYSVTASIVCLKRN